MTIAAALQGRPNHASQANGALMRISPLGIFGANHPLEQVAEWARLDAALTHPNRICQQANSLFAMALACAVSTDISPQQLWRRIAEWATEMRVEPTLLDAVQGAAEAPPADYVRQQGWVLTAFRNALWQLLHAPNFEEGVEVFVSSGSKFQLRQEAEGEGAVQSVLLAGLSVDLADIFP
jgi:ADP-ribosylglycohydrolase